MRKWGRTQLGGGTFRGICLCARHPSLLVLHVPDGGGTSWWGGGSVLLPHVPDGGGTSWRGGGSVLLPPTPPPGKSLPDPILWPSITLLLSQ